LITLDAEPPLGGSLLLQDMLLRWLSQASTGEERRSGSNF